MATNPQHIQLTDEQRKQLSELAEQTGKPWTQVFSEALRSYHPNSDESTDAAEGDSAYDSLKHAGLIGCIEGGPPDLSTNPKYMEGFGRDDHETGPR